MVDSKFHEASCLKKGVILKKDLCYLSDLQPCWLYNSFAQFFAPLFLINQRTNGHPNSPEDCWRTIRTWPSSLPKRDPWRTHFMSLPESVLCETHTLPSTLPNRRFDSNLSLLHFGARGEDSVVSHYCKPLQGDPLRYHVLSSGKCRVSGCFFFFLVVGPSSLFPICSATISCWFGQHVGHKFLVFPIVI